MLETRSVHAEHGDEQIVRYGRAAKWFVEYEPDRMRSCRRLSVRAAAVRAVALEQDGGVIHVGLPGGNTFDRLVRHERGAAL